VAGKTAEREERRKDHAVAFVVGALLGGVGGAAWTLFNVSRSGAETRAAIVRSVDAALDGTREAVREAGERVADRLAMAIDSVAGGGAADLPEPEQEPAPAAPAVPTTTVDATAAGPADGIDTTANGVPRLDEEPAPQEPAGSSVAGLTLDPGEVDPAPAPAPAGTTS
jgi:hypothetical protein